MKIEDLFLPYELCVKFQKIGFTQECFKCYKQLFEHDFDDQRSGNTFTFNIGNPIQLVGSDRHQKHETFLCYALTYEQATHFFLEKYGLWIYVNHEFRPYIIQNGVNLIHNGELFQIENNKKKYVWDTPQLAYQAAFNYLIDNIEYEKNSLEIR